MSSFCGDWATCYSLCDTNILHYTLRHWDYWTSLSRPSLTRWLNYMIPIYKIFKKQRVSYTSSRISSCTKWREEQKKKRWATFVKASFADRESAKNSSQRYRWAQRQRKHTSEQKDIGPREKNLPQKSLESERTQKVQGWLPHTAQTKMQTKLSWDSKDNKYKNKTVKISNLVMTTLHWVPPLR